MTDPLSPVHSDRLSEQSDKAARLAKANELIEFISQRGRRFFHHKGNVSRFEIDSRGRVWILDGGTGRRVLTVRPSQWRGFSEGGTLRFVCERLSEFIRYGTPLPPWLFGPWPDHICNGDLWAYGAENMAAIRDKAADMMAQEPAHV